MENRNITMVKVYKEDIIDLIAIKYGWGLPSLAATIKLMILDVQRHAVEDKLESLKKGDLNE